MNVQPIAAQANSNRVAEHEGGNWLASRAARASALVSNAGWDELSHSIGGAALATKMNHAPGIIANGAPKALMVAGKYLPIVNGGVGIYNTRQAYQVDKASGDPYYTETTKAGFGAAVAFGLGLTVTATVAAVSVTALPAIALGIGAAYTGQAIGEEIGN